MSTLTLLTYPGPNDRKARIMLSEARVPYQAKTIDIKKGEQFHPDFLKISPNNKIPALVDNSGPEPVAVFETGAILIYLAEKYNCLLPETQPRRAEAFSWLFFGTGALGGTLPQLHHYLDAAESPQLVIKRFADEAVRLFTVLERRLEQNEYLAGNYSIADIPSYVSTSGWLDRVKSLSEGKLQQTPNIDRWLNSIDGREAIRGV